MACRSQRNRAHRSLCARWFAASLEVKETALSSQSAHRSIPSLTALSLLVPLWFLSSTRTPCVKNLCSPPLNLSTIHLRASSRQPPPNPLSSRLDRSTSNVLARSSAPRRPLFASPLPNVLISSSKKSTPSGKCSGGSKKSPLSSFSPSV